MPTKARKKRPHTAKKQRPDAPARPAQPAERPRTDFGFLIQKLIITLPLALLASFTSILIPAVRDDSELGFAYSIGAVVIIAHSQAALTMPRFRQTLTRALTVRIPLLFLIAWFGAEYLTGAAELDKFLAAGGAVLAVFLIDFYLKRLASSFRGLVRRG
jgi:hypothetical protein